MASSPETAPSGNNNGTVVSRPPPPESPPPASQSPPPSSTPASPPPSPPSDSSPLPPDSPATPPPSTTPAQSPPPDNPTPPPPPADSGSPPSDSSPAPILSPPIFSPPIFSPPPPRARGSQTPPSAALSPPPPQSRSSVPSSSSSSSDSNADVAIIAGIVGGGVAILALLIICLMCSRKKKKQYYVDHGLPHKGGDKYSNGSSKRNSPPKDHIVNLPPPPGIMGMPVGGWGAPSPPPMAHNSNDFNPGYSGQYPMPMQPPPSNMGGYGAKSQFTYEELAAATGGFSQTNLLGQGGFGLVHKGVLPNGKEVAVKSLKSGSGQGEREFQAEVEIISRVHHRHLVSLVGYCIAGDKRMLVYEFVPNKTLEFHLHRKDQLVMDWTSRLRIAVGSAKGLAYLHEDCQPRIIHRDIKAANILIDFNFEAMVADFGLAKLTSDNFTHVSTRVMGTFGYLAPEYAASGKLTEKSDVFSFGVMLLELITGRRPVDPTNITMEDSLVDWARPLLSKALEDGDYGELVDPRLGDNYIAHEMARMIACASACIRHSARRRPRMSQIVRALDGNSSLDDLNEGVKTGQSASYNPYGSREVYDTCAYNADIMKFRQMVMASDNSTEYGATSEYGLNPSSSSSDSKEMDITSHQKQKL